jgi:hypothetical protein
MAKLPKDEIERVIENKMPDYKVVPKKPTSGSRDSSAPVLSDTPDIAALRQKYLRRRPGSDVRTDTAKGNPGRDDNPLPTTDDDAIVAVDPKDRSRDVQLPGGSRSKRVVISGDSKDIIGRQG